MTRTIILIWMQNLVEVSDKEEKLLPDEDLKWEEDEEKGGGSFFI